MANNVPAIVRASLRDAFSKAADLVRKKAGSRRSWSNPSDDDSTRAHSSAVSEAVDDALREVADSLDEVSRAFADAQEFVESSRRR